MDATYAYLIGIFFINSVYLFGKFILALLLKVHDKEVFLGFGKSTPLQLNFKHLKVHIGLFIPLPFIPLFFKYDNGVKEPITYEWQLFDRPRYGRLIATFGGGISALLMSMLIFSSLAYYDQEVYLSKKELNKYGIFPSPKAEEIGLRKGDKILKVNGEDYERYTDLINPEVLLADQFQYQILRDGDTIDLSLSWLGVVEEDLALAEFFMVPNAPHEIHKVVPGSQAESADILPGDVIKSINDNEVLSMEEMRSYFGEYAGEFVLLEIRRGEQILQLEVEVDEIGKIGFYSSALLDYTYEQKSIVQSLLEGISRPFRVIGINLKGINKLFTGDLTPRKNMQGPVRIADLFGDDSLYQFFNITALLLALMFCWELLPLPKSAALKSLPIFIELITKRQVPLDAFKKIQKAGWIMIGLFMASVFISDMMKFF